MCFRKQPDKWKQFEPTQEYLDTIKPLTSIVKLWDYSKTHFNYKGDIKDYWCTPIEFLAAKDGDCENWCRWYVDILVRVINQDGARFIIHSGYNKARWGDKLNHHAICVFPYKDKYAVLDVKQFASGYEDYIATGRRMFPDGLTYQEVRDWAGRILSKKRRLFGGIF